MKPTAFIGVDPGMTGAIAILHANREPNILPVLLLENGELDLYRMKLWLEKFLDWSETICVIEQVFRPNKLVYCAGILEGMIRILSHYPQIHRVAPITWRKYIFNGDDITKYKKSWAVGYCQDFYPEVDLFHRTYKLRKPDHNIAEAVLIAHYAKMKFGQ